MFPSVTNSPTIKPDSSTKTRKKWKISKCFDFDVENVENISPTTNDNSYKRKSGKNKSLLKLDSSKINNDDNEKNKENLSVKKKTKKRVTIIEDLKDDEDSDSPYTTRSGKKRVSIRKTPRKSTRYSNFNDSTDIEEGNHVEQQNISTCCLKRKFSSSLINLEDIEEVASPAPKKKRSTFNLEETVTEVDTLKRHSEIHMMNASRPFNDNDSTFNRSERRLTFELEEPVVLNTTNKLEKSVHFSIKNDDIPKMERSNTFTKEENSFSLINESNITMRKKLIKDSNATDTSLMLDNQSMPLTDFSFSSNEDSISPKKNFVKLNKKVKLMTPKSKCIEPSRTSTPFSTKKSIQIGNNSMAQQRKCLFNESTSSLSTSIKRTKLPNFAKIHQKALDKIEDIREMQKRKEERAKLLLSGHKPPANSSMKKKSPVKSSPNKPTTSKTFKRQLDYNKPVMKSKIPRAGASKTVELTQPMKKINVHKETIGTGPTKFGFKPNVNVTKQEQIKAVANRTKISQNSLETRRNTIKGVRSNRRFELLMSMRDKK